MSVAGLLEIEADGRRMRGVGLSTDVRSDKRNGPMPHEAGTSDTVSLEIGASGCRMHNVMLSTNRKTNYRIDQSDRLTRPVIGAAMRVHNRLGPGLKEAMYQKALSLELLQSGLSFVAEQPVEISTEEGYLGLLYLDHLVEEQLVVEEKAFSHLLTFEEVAQVITYLCATGKPVALLLNFGRKRLEFRRIFAPKNLDQWRNRIRRYVWMPPGSRFVNSVSPFVDSQSVDGNPGALR